MAWKELSQICLFVIAQLLILTCGQTTSPTVGLPGSNSSQTPAAEDAESENLPDKYLVTVPKVLIEGSTEIVCVNLYEMKGPVHIKVLLTYEDNEAELLEYFMEFPYACLEFTVPGLGFQGSSKSVTISVHVKDGQFSNPWEYTLWAEKDIQIEKFKVETFIETDKPIYKPGQTVKFRVLSLDQNLRADKATVDKIWVETPSGIRIAQWLSVTGEQGLISLELPMTSDPMLGKWKIFVEHRGVRSEQEFTVDEYVLPKFEVTIDGPSYLLVNETTVQYKICARYTYGQPVEGSVFAELSPEFSYARDERESVVFESENTGTSGCVDASFNITGFTLMETFYEMYNSKLKLDVIFTELATGVEVYEESEDCKLAVNAYSLEFVSKNFFKKGLPFTGKVRLTKPDGSPVENKVVRVELSNGEYSEDLTTDSKGLATFVVSNLSQASRFEASVPDMPSERRRGMFSISARRAFLSVKPQFSPSDSFLQISLDSAAVSVFSEMVVQIAHTGSRAVHTRDLGTMFISKGNIIRPQITFSERRSATADSMNYRVIELRFEVTPDMAPLTKLLVYYVKHSGEVVADSVQFEVNQQLANKVEISFKENQEKPGEDTELLISAAPDSICGVGIVDKSVYLLGGGSNNIQEQQVTEFLKNYQLDAGSGIGTQKCESHRPPWWRGPMDIGHHHSQARDSSSAFDDAGILYMTNLDLETAPCPKYDRYPMPVARFGLGGMEFQRRGDSLDDMPIAFAMEVDDGIPLGEADEAPQPPRLRAYFPETWLWDLILVEGTGQASINLTVPDTITEWIGNGFCISETQGIGISSTSSLQAFQPFFLSYTLPYSVIRGENFPVKVTVFNYMADCLVIELTMSESENFTLAPNEEQSRSICVCGSQSSSVEFNIIPNIIGFMPIEVTAVSINDGLGLCGNEFVTTVANAGDAIRKEILVEAEGIEQEDTRSEFFCPSDLQDGFVWTQELEPPIEIVPDTAWAKVVLTGDVMGPTLSNLEHLVQIPYGCGEQNMLTFVPNVLAMQYLTVTNQLTPDVAKRATDNMKLGYQREFNYRHSDGSFSAFGENDPSGSTWLTAYVVRSFYQASQFIEVDFDDLKSSIDWLKGLQDSSGCFRSVGKLCHKDMLGGINNDLTLSAYVVISLLEAGTSFEDEVIVHGLQCLESQLDSTDDNYALSQMAYALALGNSSRCSDVLERLEGVADYEGGKHWTSNRQTSSSGTYHRPSSADVEMTSYVLMTYLKVYSRSDIIAEGLPISRWLVQRRNARGGFGSTQDTVVGLTALARFSEYTVAGDLDITLTVESSEPQDSWGTAQVLRATSSNRLVLQQLYTENVPTTLNFQGSGLGCALLQVSLFYNTYPEEPEEPEFYLEVSIEDHPQFPDCTRFEAEVCAGYSSDDEASNMAVIDFRLQSGYTADKASLDLLKETNHLLKRYEVDGKSVIFYFDEITNKPTCVTFGLVQDIKVKETKPSFVTVYDYYKTEVRKTVTYALICSTQMELPLQPQARIWGSLGPVAAPIIENCPPKIGTCPYSENHNCGNELFMHDCTDDSQCPGERKCCQKDCSQVCIYPDFPVPQPEPLLPTTESPPTHSAGCLADGCPIYEEELPLDWVNKFCHSYYVAVMKVKGRNRAKVFENYRYGEEDLRITVTYTLDDRCSSNLVPNTRYIIFTDYESLDEDQREMTIKQTALIVPFKRKYLKNFDQGLCPIA